MVYRTPFGLRIRAVGEHPDAAESVGVQRASACATSRSTLSGMLAGLGGVYLALDQHQFTDQMTAGRGFIALAAVIFGRWDPDARGTRLSAVRRGGDACRFSCREATRSRQQFIEMIPYVLTIVALAGVVGRAVPPAALGKAQD